MGEIINYYLKALKEYANFNGCATRSEFWYFTLVNIVISIILNGLEISLIGTNYIALIYSLIVLVPSIAVATRRLHDINKSGWWQLIGLIPIIGLIVLIIWYATDTKPNKY
jgi:uncharacterized membrane protein YhaH (DUF805 family)